MNNITMTYDNFVSQFVCRFPSLKDEYMKEMEYWADETPGAHVYFTDVISSWLETILDAKLDGLLHEIFRDIETLLLHEDIRIREVLAFSLMEKLHRDGYYLSDARKYMGPVSRALSNEVMIYFDTILSGDKPEYCNILAYMIEKERILNTSLNGMTHLEKGRQNIAHLRKIVSIEKMSINDLRLANTAIQELVHALPPCEKDT